MGSLFIFSISISYICSLMIPAEQYETVIGLELHVQLLTSTKLFCSDSTLFGAEPNSQVSPISLAHPGTLPRLNKAVIPMAVKLGLALNCMINRENYFARKNYFYPDLPRGYQVSQHTTPICGNGHFRISVNGAEKDIRINRIHMEEDAGKTIHGNNGFSFIDYNRAGMPLLEIVTEPDLRSADEAYAFVVAIRKLVRKLGVCDGNMEEGSFRVDVNISVRKKGTEKLGTKAEIKNLNSIRFIKKAIAFESGRMKDELLKGERIMQETRGFRGEDGTTFLIRRKEDEDDYRYFAEPDLPPVYISENLIEEQRQQLPADAAAIKKRLISTYYLNEPDAQQLAEDEELYIFFECIAASTKNYKAAANWTLGNLRKCLTEKEMEMADLKIRPSSIARIIDLVDEKKINYGTATHQLFPALLQDPDLNPDEFIDKESLQLSGNDDALEDLVNAALLKFEVKIKEYKKGKKGLMSLFVGEVMKQSKGKADALTVQEKIAEKIKNQE